MRIVIIGGVAGGASAGVRIRRLDEKAEITILERGDYVSFANCGLPYYIGGEITDKSALTLQTPNSLKKRFNIDVRVNNEVIKINRYNKTVSVTNLATKENYDLVYDKLIIATGAEPIVPSIDGFFNPKVFRLRTIPDTLKIKSFIEKSSPKRAVVIGGGYIGLEMAENLFKQNIEVFVIEMSNQLLTPLDYDMACDVHNYIRNKGIELLLSTCVTKIKESQNGLIVCTDKGELNTDMVISCIGVKPESNLAERTGLKLNSKGGIIVNSNMQTSDVDIYAVGDVAQVYDFVSNAPVQIPLASPANKQGRICADNICGIERSYNATQGTSIVKVFDMTIATSGINEKSAIANDLEYEKSYIYTANHATYYPNASNMSIKTIFDKKTAKILGAQIVGFDGVDKRMDILATAIRNKMTAFDLSELELCYAPPFGSAKDPINAVGYVIENIVTGKVKVFHWHDIPQVQMAKNVVLLDVRTEQEYAHGKINGFINIPLDTLRSRLNELDSSKIIYVHCQSGLRSYLACRILTQNGFNCYNLSGGYRLYKSIFLSSPPNVRSSYNCYGDITEHNTKD